MCSDVNCNNISYGTAFCLDLCMRLVDQILLALTRNIIVSQGGKSLYKHIKKQRKNLRHGI